MAKWLDKYEQGGLVLKKKTKDNYGKKPNVNDVKVSAGPNFVGEGYTAYNWKSPAWGGQFAMGGALPGSVGFMYARTQNPAPANGKYTKKTLASAQNGQEMKYYQDGLDFKPKSISKKGKKIVKDDRGQWAHPGEVTEIGSNDITMQGVDYPVLGISDTGDTQMMYPDQDYKFDGEKVTEFPMMEKGGWLDKYKAQTGITTNIEAGTINPTAQLTTLAKEAERKVKEKAKDKAIVADRKKRIAASVAAKKQPFSAQQLADVTQATGDKFRLFPNDPDSFIDEYINPGVFIGNLASGMGRVPLDIQQGNYGKAALNVAMPAMIGAGEVIVAPYLKQAGKYLTENTALKNAYKYNPLAFKPKADAYYRMVGEGGYADALKSGVVRPPVGSGHTETYFNKGYPLDTRLREVTGRSGYGGPYMAEVKGNPELFVNENVANYTGPMFEDPVVYSKQNIPINNPDVKFYKENWLRGYKEVPKPVTQGTTNASPSNYFSDLIRSGASYLNEKSGEKLAGAENRASIAEGNKWSQDWASHPETARKIRQQIIDQKTFGNINPEIFDRINTPQTMQDYQFLTNYKAGAAEYPLDQQTKDLINTIKGKNRYSTSMIHGDNLGVSYRHQQNPLLDMDDYIPGIRSSGPGTWISRGKNMDQAGRKSVTIHENAHDWLRADALERLGYKDEIESHLSQDAIDASTKWVESGYNTKKHHLGYLADPTEVHARIMETRHHFGLTPTDKVTPEMAEGMLQVIRQGKVPTVSKQFADIFSSPKGVAQLFNKLPAVAPVAVGVGAAAALPKEQKNGGWLNKYK